MSHFGNNDRIERRLKIGVWGPHTIDESELALGREVGVAIARSGAILLCGGLDGMMAAAAEGAKRAGGETVGILPGDSSEAANDFIDLAIPTGLGVYRNAVLVRACDAVIAVRGAYGTLSEIAFALRMDIPVVGLETWSLVRDGEVDKGVHVAESPQHAVELALDLCRK